MYYLHMRVESRKRPQFITSIKSRS